MSGLASRFRRWGFALAVVAATLGLRAAERIPPVPARHFNDYAGVVRRETADVLNARLEEFERTTSNQLVVALYPKMESDSSVEDYTVRVAQAWRVGQKGRDNGAILFGFMQEHQLYLQVGYGLEGAIPDALAKRIVERDIVPRFRQQDYDGGLTAAVAAMMAASKGEYTGSGRTVGEGRRRDSLSVGPGAFVTFFIAVMIVSAVLRRTRSVAPLILGHALGRPRSRTWMGPGGGSWPGGGWGGGGGGGGFSGGGGSFGGGGAGGKW